MDSEGQKISVNHGRDEFIIKNGTGDYLSDYYAQSKKCIVFVVRF